MLREFFELSAHKLFSLVGNDQHGRTKILDPSFSNALRHRPDSLVQDRHAQLVTPCCRKRFWNHPETQSQKGPHQVFRYSEKSAAALQPRFWRMPLGCTCWTLELSSHVVENLWSGTTDEQPSRIPPCSGAHKVMIDLLLARCQRFPDNLSPPFSSSRSVSSVTISSASLPSGSRSVSTRKEQATFKSFRSDRDCVTRRFFSVWPMRFPNKYTRSSSGRATSSPSNHAW